MSMLEKIRSSTDSTAMKVVFICIVLVFVFFGVGGSAGMMSTQPVATVNGTRINDTELQRLMRGRVRELGGSSLDEDQVKVLSQQVLEQLILDEVLAQEAHRIGLEVSTEEMQRYVLDFDAFKDEQGAFSAELYGRNLKRMGLTKGAFEEGLREDLLRAKLREVVVASVDVSEAEVRDLYDRTATQAELRFVRILDADIAQGLSVDEPAIDQFLATNAAQVTQAYEADKSRLYSRPRSFAFRRITLRKEVAGVSDEDLMARMVQIRQQALDGADFSELARRWSEDLGAVTGGGGGLVPEPQLEPSLVNAALVAGAGKVTEIVDTDRGLILLFVDQIAEASETPLEEVKRQIARDLIARQEASRLGGERAERLLAAWKSGGAAPEALATELGLTISTTAPFTPTDSYIPGLGVAPALSQAVVDQGRAGLLDAVYPVEGGRLIAEVSNWTGADEARFAMVKGFIQYQLLQEKQGRVLEQWQAAQVAQAKIERFLR